MKTAKYNKVEMTIKRVNAPQGRYIITGKRNGQTIAAYTDDSEIYDFFTEDYPDDPNWARRAAYKMLRPTIIEVIAYREGGNWVYNENGTLYRMPHHIRSVGDVRKAFREAGECTNVVYKVTFA